MNIFTCTCRVVADAETRYTQGGAAICNVRLVADSGYGERKKPLWINGALFGKRAEGGLVPLLVKGQQLAVSGELSMREWENKDGIKVQSLELNIATIDLIGSKQGDAGSGSSGHGGMQEPPPMGDDQVPF